MADDEGTPGPWWFRHSNFDQAKLLVYVQGNRGTCLDHVCIVPTQYDVELRDDPPTRTRNAGRQEANARLIAAAPDLLAACETIHLDVVRYLDRGGSLTESEIEHVQQLQTAIRKARGT